MAEATGIFTGTAGEAGLGVAGEKEETFRVREGECGAGEAKYLRV